MYNRQIRWNLNYIAIMIQVVAGEIISTEEGILLMALMLLMQLIVDRKQEKRESKPKEESREEELKEEGRRSREVKIHIVYVLCWVYLRVVQVIAIGNVLRERPGNQTHQLMLLISVGLMLILLKEEKPKKWSLKVKK